MLKPSHQKALALIREGGMSLQEVAKASGITISYLYDLIEGKPSAGNVGQEFKSELNKIEAQLSVRTKINMRTLKDILVDDLLQWNDSLPKDPLMLKPSEVEQKRKILADLNKAQAGVEIGEFHYHTGLSGEDLINEFKRLRSLVKSAVVGPGVPEAITRRQGILSSSSKAKVRRAKEEEASELSPESEAGDLS